MSSQLRSRIISSNADAVAPCLAKTLASKLLDDLRHPLLVLQYLALSVMSLRGVCLKDAAALQTILFSPFHERSSDVGRGVH